MTGTLHVIEPKLQSSFFLRLQAYRDVYLSDALQRTVSAADLTRINTELEAIVEPAALQIVAASGLRGEIVFAMPSILRGNPFLLAYYRLFLGFSQKEFYNKGPFGRFKRLEEAGEISKSVAPQITDLCISLSASASRLVLAMKPLLSESVHELQLLTLGAQFRGTENTRVGQRATKGMRQLVEEIVTPFIHESTGSAIILKNASGRFVRIEFLSDPDIWVTERLETEMRPTLAIEIKGGGDASNIHNRLGEAEKSHLKAARLGFREFWTIIAVDLEDSIARRGSPTTNLFFNLRRLSNPADEEARRFRNRFASFLGIPAS